MKMMPDVPKGYGFLADKIFESAKEKLLTKGQFLNDVDGDGDYYAYVIRTWYEAARELRESLQAEDLPLTVDLLDQWVNYNIQRDNTYLNVDECTKIYYGEVNA